MIDKNLKTELEKLKQLLDTNIISESEYNILKEEILFKRNSKNEYVNIRPKFEPKKESDINKINQPSKQNSNSSYTYLIIIFFIISFLVWNTNDNSDETELNNNTINTESSLEETDSYISTTTCKICGKEFSGDGFDKIDGIWKKNTNIQTELCSQSCAKKEEKNIDDKYDEILRKNGYNPSMQDAPIQHYGEYIESSDGRIYENNKCGLCNGTGIEKNMSSLSDEYGRICPMCDGKGVRSY